MSRETPGDGSCMFQTLLDQIKSNPSLPDYAENHWELRYKLVFEGCDKVIDKLHWPMRTALDLIKDQAIARGSMPGCQLTLLIIMTNYNDTISVSEYYYCMSS